MKSFLILWTKFDGYEVYWLRFLHYNDPTIRDPFSDLSDNILASYETSLNTNVHKNTQIFDIQTWKNI